ncbi:ABC transporter permease, partial [Streptomyces sp. SID7499]|nr:ABC transporter permease [Streptomyces sp. SID7499]
MSLTKAPPAPPADPREPVLRKPSTRKRLVPY